MLKAFLHKLVRTEAFGDYISSYADALNPAAMTDAIEMVNMDYPELDVKKAMYGYNEETIERVGWFQAKAMVKIHPLPLVEELEKIDHILSVDEVIRVEVDEDEIFRDLDKSGGVYPYKLPCLPNP